MKSYTRLAATADLMAIVTGLLVVIDYVNFNNTPVSSKIRPEDIERLQLKVSNQQKEIYTLKKRIDTELVNSCVLTTDHFDDKF